jgi:hypothetical protein
MTRLQFAVRAGGWHLLGSCLVAAVAALVVFLLWYPAPFAAMAGGLMLFGILVSVDVVLGPTLTALVASPSKPCKELARDIALIAVVQLAAFGYGLHSLAIARPVFLSFEIDRLRVVTAVDVDTGQLGEAQPGLRELPWTGPKLIAAVKATNNKDFIKSVESALAGFDISMVPRNWREFSSQSDAAWRVARPLSVLVRHYPESESAIAAVAAASGQTAEQLRFLPVLSRRASWVAVVASPGARIVGYLPIEGFF